jgi:hypothetical protein|tara:strand:+ start:261 stop:440 length:180 start_codon:yes stop_codon:yes gene_type:complete
MNMNEHKQVIEQVRNYLNVNVIRIRSDVANISDKLDTLDSLINTLDEILNKEEDENEKS